MPSVCRPVAASTLTTGPGLRFIGGLARSHDHQEAQDEGSHHHHQDWTKASASPAMAVAFAALFVALAGTALSQGTPPPGTPPATCNGLAATLVGYGEQRRCVERHTWCNGCDRRPRGRRHPRPAAGDDVICGGPGRDTLRGPGQRHPARRGGQGLARRPSWQRHPARRPRRGPAHGQPGNDTLLGEAGRDALAGGAGKDLCVGGPGKDIDRPAHRYTERTERRPDGFFIPIPWKCEVKKSI